MTKIETVTSRDVGIAVPRDNPERYQLRTMEYAEFYINHYKDCIV